MKLAEALAMRADLQTKINQISQRLNNNARVQEGEKPNENPHELINEIDDSLQELEKLIKQINYTNCNVIVDGVSLTDMLAKKDVLTTKQNILTVFLNEASSISDRYSKTEIKVYSSVDVSKLQKEVNTLSKSIRQLDLKIQGINWTTELIEK